MGQAITAEALRGLTDKVDQVNLLLAELGRGGDVPQDQWRSRLSALRAEIKNVIGSEIKRVCAYCGDAEPLDPEDPIGQMQAHIKVCKAHPFARMRRALDRVRAERDALRAELEGAQAQL